MAWDKFDLYHPLPSCFRASRLDCRCDAVASRLESSCTSSTATIITFLRRVFIHTTHSTSKKRNSKPSTKQSRRPLHPRGIAPVSSLPSISLSLNTKKTLENVWDDLACTHKNYITFALRTQSEWFSNRKT